MACFDILGLRSEIRSDKMPSWVFSSLALNDRFVSRFGLPSTLFIFSPCSFFWLEAILMNPLCADPWVPWTNCLLKDFILLLFFANILTMWHMQFVFALFSQESDLPLPATFSPHLGISDLLYNPKTTKAIKIRPKAKWNSLPPPPGNTFLLAH